jgi:hypothetical protein
MTLEKTHGDKQLCGKIAARPGTLHHFAAWRRYLAHAGFTEF